MFARQAAFAVGSDDLAGYSNEVWIDEALVFQPIELTGKRKRVFFRHSDHASLALIVLGRRIRGRGSFPLGLLVLEVRGAADVGG